MRKIKLSELVFRLKQATGINDLRIAEKSDFAVTFQVLSRAKLRPSRKRVADPEKSFEPSKQALVSPRKCVRKEMDENQARHHVQAEQQDRSS